MQSKDSEHPSRCLGRRLPELAEHPPRAGPALCPGARAVSTVLTAQGCRALRGWHNMTLTSAGAGGPERRPVFQLARGDASTATRPSGSTDVRPDPAQPQTQTHAEQTRIRGHCCSQSLEWAEKEGRSWEVFFNF